jgi:hypothetical protein
MYNTEKCSQCNKTYIGQTEKSFKIRNKEYIHNIKCNKDSLKHDKHFLILIECSTFPWCASYPVGTGGSFPGGKARPGRDADHSPPSSAEVKNE